jgi:hypothetical protein
MTILGRLFAAMLALVVVSPGAQARPKLGPGLILAPLAIVGGIAGAAMGSRKARAHRSYKHRPSARRDRGTVRRAVAPAAPAAGAVAAAPATTALAAPSHASAAPAGWAGPLFWPHAYDGVFEYAFGLPGDDSQFWARGFGDVIDGMFMPPQRRDSGARRTVGIGNPQARTWEGLCGSEAPKAADATVERIRQVVQLNEPQQSALNELREGLIRATERIEAACPESHAATPPERLRMMTARLAAMRQAVLAVQGPLREFYEQLSDQQKAALEHAGSDGDDPRAGAGMASGCAAPVADWPQEHIERVLQPTKPQRALLEQLRQTSLGLAQFVASTCPKEVPRTALQRLDAIKDRLAVLRYAASNISPVFDQFYASLSESQKARFQRLARERRADSRR